MIPPRGRLLGVDPGTVRIGLAVSDAERRVSSPLETFRRRSAEVDAAWFRNHHHHRDRRRSDEKHDYYSHRDRRRHGRGHGNAGD